MKHLRRKVLNKLVFVLFVSVNLINCTSDDVWDKIGGAEQHKILQT